jgi:hypothetical protein
MPHASAHGRSISFARSEGASTTISNHKQTNPQVWMGRYLRRTVPPPVGWGSISVYLSSLDAQGTATVPRGRRHPLEGGNSTSWVYRAISCPNQAGIDRSSRTQRCRQCGKGAGGEPVVFSRDRRTIQRADLRLPRVRSEDQRSTGRSGVVRSLGDARFSRAQVESSGRAWRLERAFRFGHRSGPGTVGEIPRVSLRTSASRCPLRVDRTAIRWPKLGNVLRRVSTGG